MKKFPKTLAAIKTAEQDQWAIGDALLAECGPPMKAGAHNPDTLQEAAQFLLQEGYQYAAPTLNTFRTTAHSFPLASRHRGIAFHAHRVAATPAYLEAILAGAPKGKVTQAYIQKIRSTQLEKAKREREAAAREAEEARKKAEAEEAAARKKADRDEVKNAAEKTAQARAKEQEVRVAPKPKITPPEKEEVSQLEAEAQFLANAAKSVVQAKKASKDIQDVLDHLDGRSVRALTEAALEAANAWTEAAHIVRSEVQNKHGHLSVVGE